MAVRDPARLRAGSARRRPGRLSSERGSSLVEFTLILPILGALLIGMLYGGMAYQRKLSLTNGAREGARYGATLPVDVYPNLNAWLDQVSSVSVGAVDDTLPSGVSGRYVCVAFVHPDGIIASDQSTKRVESGGTVGYSSGPCFNDGRPSAERRVQVVVARDTSLNALVFSRTVRIQGKSVARFEALSG
jgi:hypothetical protein